MVFSVTDRDGLTLAQNVTLLDGFALLMMGGGSKVMPNTYLEELATAAPVNFDRAVVDWAGMNEALQRERLDQGSALAVSWCRFGIYPIEAGGDSPALAIIHPRGIILSEGKRKLFSKALKYDNIYFGSCRDYGPTEHTDERGFGKYCIEFAGAGGVLLGRLQWTWQARRFRDSRGQIMAVAEERDRILGLIKGLLG